jgi:hypothetical protein
MNSGCGALQSNTTVASSGVVIWPGSETKREKTATAPRFIASMRSYDAFTAAASHGDPSWKVSPGRILKVQTLESSLASQLSATSPSYSSVALPSRPTNAS